MFTWKNKDCETITSETAVNLRKTKGNKVRAAALLP
jgi:hypothetical protein